MKILVTDGDNRASLAITRSLGKKGHRIIVGGTKARSLASSSRFCAGRFVYADPFTASEKFVENVFEYMRKNSVDVIIPVSDVTVMELARNKRLFEAHCTLATPDEDVVQAAADKIHTVAKARELGIPVPGSVVVQSREEMPHVYGRLDYPLVIKPGRSRVRVGTRWYPTTVSYADCREQLEKGIAKLMDYEFPIMLQERITGPGGGVFACCHDGQILAMFSHRRIREKPPSGGVSVLRESVPVDAAAGRDAERLLSSLDWEGVAMVEFKYDVAEKEHKFLEVNGRFWGSLQLAIDSGVDFPAILLDCVGSGEPTTNSGYRYGVKTRWLWGDVDALFIEVFKKDSSLEGAPKFRKRWNAVKNFMRTYGDDIHYEVLWKSDINPWLYESKEWLTQCLGRRESKTE